MREAVRSPRNLFLPSSSLFRLFRVFRGFRGGPPASIVSACVFLLALAFSGCTRPETIDGSQFNQTQWETRLKAPSLSQKEFTRLYAQAVAAELKGAKVQIIGER